MSVVTNLSIGDAIANAVNVINPMSPANLAILKTYWEPIASGILMSGAGGITAYSIVTAPFQHGVQASGPHGFPGGVAPTMCYALGCDGGLQVRSTPLLVDLGSGNLGVTVRFDNQDEVLTDWISYTPTGSWVTNATYTGKYRRVGDTMEVQVHIALSGAPSGSLALVSIPTPFVIDTTKLVNTTNAKQSHGMGTMVCAGVGDYLLNIAYRDTTSVRPVSFTITGYPNNGVAATGVGDVGISATVPATFAAGDVIDMMFKVPIVGWTAFPAHTANVTLMLIKL